MWQIRQVSNTWMTFGVHRQGKLRQVIKVFNMSKSMANH